VSPGYIYLPDFRSKTPVGYNDGVDHIGETGGANTYKITQENLPAIPDHTHVLNSDATSGGDAILTITDTLTSSNGGHYHALMYGHGENYEKYTEAECETIKTTHLSAKTARAHKANENGIGGSFNTIGSLGADVNYYVLYPTTHDNEFTHDHKVDSITSTLTGNTGYVVPYTKTATEINMRSAYLVTNFIIKY
jgi:microcystin-dependent protein